MLVIIWMCCWSREISKVFDCMYTYEFNSKSEFEFLVRFFFFFFVFLENVGHFMFEVWKSWLYVRCCYVWIFSWYSSLSLFVCIGICFDVLSSSYIYVYVCIVRSVWFASDMTVMWCLSLCPCPSLCLCFFLHLFCR